jgi:hypothetical protein
LACIEYKFSRVVHLTFDENKKKNSIKAQILSDIKIHGKNVVEAGNAVCILKTLKPIFERYLPILIYIFFFHRSLLICDFLVFAPISVFSGTLSSPSALQNLVQS